MESMRDVNRVMEREIAKGSSPLKLDHIEFGEYSYQEISSKEKLLEVLSYLLRIGDFSQSTTTTSSSNSEESVKRTFRFVSAAVSLYSIGS